MSTLSIDGISAPTDPLPEQPRLDTPASEEIQDQEPAPISDDSGTTVDTYA